MKSGIVFIGLVTTGKSTQGKLIIKALGKEHVCLDAIAIEKYYEPFGWDLVKYKKMQKTHGQWDAYLDREPSEAYAAQQVVKDYSDSVIYFGAGHSHYQDRTFFESVKEALADVAHVIFLLSSPDLERSVTILRQRCLEQHKTDWILEGYDFIEHWVKSECNSALATMTIYTEGQTPEETKDEIFTYFNGIPPFFIPFTSFFMILQIIFESIR